MIVSAFVMFARSDFGSLTLAIATYYAVLMGFTTPVVYRYIAAAAAVTLSGRAHDKFA